MADDPRSLKFFSRYIFAEKHWSSSVKFDYRSVRREFTYRLAADEFLQTLNSLYVHTDHRCFLDAADVLLERGIINADGWNTDALVPVVANVEDRCEAIAISLLRFFIDSGMSRRLAMANTAANLRWPGNSFEAAVKSIERLCQDASQQKDRTTPAGKCPKTTSA